MAITSFKNQYFFLSNFSPSNLLISGLIFPTVEHYYQAMKATSYEDYLAIHSASTPSQAKKMGKIIRIRPDWKQVKESIMSYALYNKFSDMILQNKLLSTGTEELIEGNDWHDYYWGIDNKTGKGQNKLGKLLMQVRDYYQSIADSNYKVGNIDYLTVTQSP